MDHILPWLPVLLGSIIAVLDVRATLYFRRQYRMIGNNWIIRAFYRTSASITAVVVILTLTRITFLLLFTTELPAEEQNLFRGLVQTVAGLAVVWLAIIPILLEQYFAANEGRSEEKT